jgi:hypothetical protein
MKDLNKKIAAAIQLAHKLHEQSYVPGPNKGDTNDALTSFAFGEYTIEWGECWQQACNVQELPNDLWYVLHLANHWYNDLQWWAEEILAGRSLEFLQVDDMFMAVEKPGDPR